jgi:hypothetical protein
MEKFLASPYFKYFFVPLITSFLCIFVKWVSRNDRFISFRKEDLAVGLELTVASIIIFITDSVNLADTLVNKHGDQILQEKYVTIPWIILAFIVGLWGISTIVRKWGWKNENDLNIFCGIIAPNMFGIISLIFVVSWIGK